MMRSPSGIAIALALAGFASAQEATPVNPYAEETAAERDARMEWWRDARFGMFIHWGVYAVPAGTYEGGQIPGIGEWIMHRARIPSATYKAFAKDFNPVKYDAEEWVHLAEEAGMRYIVITSKHHDGFALFDSKVTDWDVVDATPYGKDLLRPLVDAAKKAGLKIGFYYSQAQDWNHPGGAKAGLQEGDGWDDAHKGDFDEYLREIAYPQVKEILSGYDLDVLWWDTPVWMNKERADLLLPLLRLRPGIVTNNRLGGGYKGDTDTPEQSIPATGIPGRDWETCMTMNDTWGFKSYDQNWKSTETLVRNLVDIASKGGNYLLNVGPTSEGLIPEASVERLKEIGAWMKVNGESIYATSPSPFAKLAWGRCTKKLREGGATLYLHVFEWPQDGRLLVPGLDSKVRAARLLAGGEKLAFEKTADGVLVSVPETAPDAFDTVIVLEVEGPLAVHKILPRPGADGSVLLGAELADIHNPGYGEHAQVETKYGAPSIGYWLDSRAWVEWPFEMDRTGEYEAVASFAAPAAGSRVTVSIGEQKIEVEVPATGGYAEFEDVSIGRFRFDETGRHALAVRPVEKDWKAVNLRSVWLMPVR